ALHLTGAAGPVQALLARDFVGYARLDDPRGVADLLGRLREAGAADAVQALAARAAGQVSLGNPQAVADLLGRLREAGAVKAVQALAARAANGGMFSLFLEFCPDEASSYRLGREPDGDSSQFWNWQEPPPRTAELRSRKPDA